MSSEMNESAERRELEEASDTGEGSADTEPLLPAPCQEGEVESSEVEKAEVVHSVEICSLINCSKNGDADPLSPDQPQCRICLDSEGDDEFIAPCRCRGTQKFVHRSCLDNWRAAKEGFAFAHCTECRAMFNLRANMPPDRWWLRLKFQLLVVRDHAALFIVVQLVVASMGMVLYTLYGDELREMFGYGRHPLSFYSLAIIVAVLVGLLYGFFISIICGQNITKRHHHILAKQELTKEYVVESVNDGEEPLPLDRGHVRELQMLGLYQ